MFQLYYIVWCININGQYGKFIEEGYFEKFSEVFVKFRNIRKVKKMKILEVYNICLYFDVVNGVGVGKILIFQFKLGDLLKISLVNDGSGKLNYECGVDFVKV